MKKLIFTICAICALFITSCTNHSTTISEVDSTTDTTMVDTVDTTVVDSVE